MPDYKKSKIYKLVSNHTDKIYVGATTNFLHTRKGQHISNYKRWKKGRSNCTSYEIVKYDDCKIILIEEYPCDSKIQLSARERYWIEKSDCVNNNVPTRTKEEYYYHNRESILLHRREYKKQNKEKIMLKSKQYNEKNREKINLHNRESYSRNKEKMQCDCGVIIYQCKMRRHLKTITHLNLVLLNIGDIF